MMSFEKFLEGCTFDISETDFVGRSAVVCIYSSGYIKEFSDDFIKSNPETAKELVAWDLYHYMERLENEDG